MEKNNDEKAIISKLFVSKETTTERLQALVSLCHGLFSIVQETGDIFLEDASNLNNNEKILLYLTGAYFAWKTNLRKDPEMSTSELAEKLGVPITTVPAPLNKLIEEHLVSKINTGLYGLRFENYKFLHQALNKIKRKKELGEA